MVSTSCFDLRTPPDRHSLAGSNSSIGEQNWMVYRFDRQSRQPNFKRLFSIARVPFDIGTVYDRGTGRRPAGLPSQVQGVSHVLADDGGDRAALDLVDGGKYAARR
jgi:hypothetical protein